MRVPHRRFANGLYVLSDGVASGAAERAGSALRVGRCRLKTRTPVVVLQSVGVAGQRADFHRPRTIEQDLVWQYL